MIDEATYRTRQGAWASISRNLMRKSRRRYLGDQHRQVIIVPYHAMLGCLGTGWKQAERLKTAAAFLTVPDMTGATIPPKLRPFRGNQLIVALNAFHSKA
jgi:hypothetical protein